MLVTAQGLADARANAKLVAGLALIGSIAGAMAGAALGYKSLPSVVHKIPAVDAAYLLRYEAARIPIVGPRLLPDFAAIREGAAREIPLVHQRIDEIPRFAGLAALLGAIGLPLLAWSLKDMHTDRQADVRRHNPLSR